MKVLIVEDSDLNARVLDLNLKKHGLETDIARNGKEGLEYLKEHSDVNLAIIDIMMPEMDGIEMLERMKQDEGLKLIPVIMCTSKNDAETVKKVIELGCNDYIVKPINPGILKEKVFNLLLPDREDGLPPRTTPERA